MKRDWQKHIDVNPLVENKILNMDKHGRYENLKDTIYRGLKKNPFTWQIKVSQLFKNRKREQWHDNSIKLTTLDFRKKYYIVWLGHSTFFLNVNGISILIDPVFGSVPFVRRIIKFPIDPSLIRNIDYILISHDHYDHLDIKSIKQVLSQSKHTKIICGAGTEDILSKLVNEQNKAEIIPLQWYDKYHYKKLEVSYLPAIHDCQRRINDKRKRLWGAFMIQFGGINLYFSGDTAYGEHFKEVKSIFGRVDYAIIGIGAFRPRPHIHRNHISPKEAIWASRDMGALHTIPMHYNTFDLSREKYIEPLYFFKKAAELNNVPIITPPIGGMIKLTRN